MKTTTIICRDERATDQLGALLAEQLPAKATVALCGTLGAGKTRLVQAIAAHNGVARDDVTSPTFVICQHYYGKTAMHHLDAYRVRDDDEWFELGVEELFEQPGWTFVEWADRFEHCLPENYLRVDIEVTGKNERTFRLTAVGEELQPVLERIQQLV